MLFNSYVFLFAFLPVVLAAFYLIARSDRRAARLFLGAASLAFYGWWDWRFVPLLIGSIAVNFALGVAIHRAAGRARHARLVAGVGLNLGLLGFFKYTNFLLGTIGAVTGDHLGLYDIILPLGISFFTFTQIAFLVDVYRGIAVEFNAANYLLFVSYFPHLIAGPVLHHKEMMPQFAAPAMGRARTEDFAVGIAMFVIGLGKKVLIADTLAPYANALFGGAAHGASPPLLVAWAGAIAYSLQIYFDFSGYSDMAIGLSRLFGVALPVNFNSPYKAASLIDFWRRWHMTLSRFLRDYLYFPLGGNRRGEARRQLNLLATMVLGGLWHGANWTFVIWGGIHGLLLSVNHGWRRRRGHQGAATLPGKAGGWMLTMLVVVVAWVFFRAANPHVALLVLAGMAGCHGIVLPAGLSPLLAPLAKPLHLVFSSVPGHDLLAVSAGHPLGPARLFALAGGVAVVLLAMPNSQQLLASYRPVLQTADGASGMLCLTGWRGMMTAAGMGALFFACLIRLNVKSPFLYFQF